MSEAKKEYLMKRFEQSLDSVFEEGGEYPSSYMVLWRCESGIGSSIIDMPITEQCVLSIYLQQMVMDKLKDE